MEFCSLRTHDFRNLTDQTISFGPRINVLVGDNGQGKTNLLEALYLLSHAKSFRSSRLSHLIKKGTEAFALKADLRENETSDQIEMRVSEKSRLLLFNEKKISVESLSKKIPAVLFSPESLQAIKEGPEHRRHLLDESLSALDSNHAGLLHEFEKVLKTKNRVLKDHLAERISLKSAQDILQSLQPNFLQRSTRLTWSRLEGLRRIELLFKKVFLDIARAENVDMSVDYVVSGQSAKDWEYDRLYESIEQRVFELGPQELRGGISLVGPHKHEIIFNYNGQDSRFFCSQGQQRAIVLSFKIAHVLDHAKVHGSAPVLLLDDVLSELDSERRDYLVRFLRESRAQTVVTTTDLSFCHDLRTESLAEFSVRDGAVNRSN